MTSYDVADYWDFTSPSCLSYTQSWYTATRTLSHAANATWVSKWGGCTKYDEYFTPGVWSDSWYYKRDPLRGILEIADESPKTNPLLFWSAVQREVYLTGKEIQWGGVQQVDTGVPISRPIQIDYSQSAVIPPFKGYWSYGQQICWYTYLPEWTDVLGRLHRDVIVIQGAQPWVKGLGSKDLSNSCARWYCVKGIGRVGVEYITYDANCLPIATSPQTAAVYSGGIVLGIN